MKIQNKNLRSRQGFTLVEMLGVLAIIAILISVIAVGVLSAINRSRIVATTATMKNIETGVTGYVALPNSGGTVPLTSGTNVVIPLLDSNGTVSGNATNGNNYSVDQVLTAAGFLEKPISWRVGTDGSATISTSTQPKYILSKRGFLASTTGVDLTAFNRVVCGTVAPTASAAIALSNTGTAVTDATFEANPQFFLDGSTALSANRVVYVVLKGVSIKDAQKLSQELNGGLDNTELTPNYQTKGRFIYAALPSATTTDCFYYVASF